MNDDRINSLHDIMAYGLQRRAAQHVTEDETLGGRTITVDGRKLVNFGSCSYLGLEHHPALVEGTIDAVRKFGTQFSSSRAYTSLGLYSTLEASLERIFEAPTVITPTTTLGHMSALPVVVQQADAVIMDMQVHSSVQMAAQLLKAAGVPTHVIRHNDMAALDKKIRQLKVRHARIWYLADGVYSMYGDYAPLDEIQRLLEVHRQLHFYVDDAHGMSWTGRHGAGYVRSRMGHHPRMVQAVSLNKAFAAAGGAVIFPNREMAQKVRNCGGTMIFSGPIQPPLLGAAIASASLHLSPEIEVHQKKLAGLVEHMNGRLEEAGLPQPYRNESPLFFVPSGLLDLNINLFKRMFEDGFYINSANFPAVPMKRGGLRFMVHAHLETSDIDDLVAALAYHYPRALAEEGQTAKGVAKSFGIEVPPVLKTALLPRRAPKLRMVIRRSIREIDATTWDARFAHRGNLAHSIVERLEEVFATADDPAQRWDFEYVDVLDERGRCVLSTFFTCAVVKDDMFAPAHVSQRIEEQRREDPAYLTSRAVMLGSLITKGDHLWLDRTHLAWREALRALMDRMSEVATTAGASQLMFREFYGGLDAELNRALEDLGLARMPLPNNGYVDELTWDDVDGFVAQLPRRYRSDLRREVLRHQDAFEVVTARPETPAELAECYELYEQVFARSFDMNVHQLPYAYFETMNQHPDFEVLRLYLRDADEPDKPVAVMFSHRGAHLYNAMIVGMDYRYLRSHDVYKQVLFQTVLRARASGAQRLDLAFTAEQVKKKVGAKFESTTAYVQLSDHYNHAVIDAMMGSGDVSGRRSAPATSRTSDGSRAGRSRSSATRTRGSPSGDRARSARP